MNQKIHEVRIDKIDDMYLYLSVDAQAYRLRWVDCSPRLAVAAPNERARLEISPAGYGLHWPLIDEDLAIDPLLKQAEPLKAEAANETE